MLSGVITVEQLSTEEKGVVVELHLGGISYGGIAIKRNTSKSIDADITRTYKERGIIAHVSITRQLHLFSERDIKGIVGAINQSRKAELLDVTDIPSCKIDNCTTQKNLHSAGIFKREAAKKPTSTTKN
ncbi:hypothetical protein BGX20_003023 [Mortierella sp. AD010]|nr:hypothetical protein BGX20_003023 [Mortierella sp. AD010]